MLFLTLNMACSFSGVRDHTANIIHRYEILISPYFASEADRHVMLINYYACFLLAEHIITEVLYWQSGA